MNVLIINPMLYTAPLKGKPINRLSSIEDTMIVDLCKGFVKIGHRVTLIASEEYKPILEQDFGFEILYFENWISKIIKKFPHGLPMLKGLKSYLESNKSKFDIVISSELFTPPSITAAKVLPEKLIIWQEFGFHLPTMHSIPSKLWHRFIVGKYIKNKVLVVPRASVTKSFIKKYCNIVSEEVINNCINTDIFSVSSMKDDYLIILSRLIPGKNIEYIIDKFTKYRKKYPTSSTRLLIVGDGPLRSSLEQSIPPDIKNSVEFKGRLSHNDLASILSRAKGFLCCTNAELNMISMTESIVAGTPILTNCVPLQYKLVNDEKLGIAKDNWDENDIAEILCNYSVYCENCRRIRNEFSNVSAAKAFINVSIKYKLYAKF